MMIGGWSSNLLDRLGMHYMTAPGSGRGAVDFIPLGLHHYNVADFFIVLGTPLFILAVSARYLERRAGDRSTDLGVTVTIIDRPAVPHGLSPSVRP
jgi:lipoprotein signal peptidase